MDENKPKSSWKKKILYFFLVAIMVSVLSYIIVPESEPVEYETLEIWSKEFNEIDRPLGIFTKDYEVVTVPDDATHIIMSIDWENGSRDTSVKIYLWESGEIKDRSLGYLNAIKLKNGSKELECEVGEVKDFFVEASVIQDCKGVISLSVKVPK